MKKYGIENFIFKEIDEDLTLEVIKDKEIAWIKELKINGYQLYNETEGGDNVPDNMGMKWSEDRKIGVSKKYSGAGNPMYGRKLLGTANGNYGKEMKQHVKDKLLQCRRKLNDEQIQKIKELYATNNYTQTQLSKDFNISLPQIHCIVKGKSWSNKKRSEILTKKRITKEDVIKIRQMYQTGKYLQTDLGKMFNISSDHVSNIITRRKWKSVK
jgi:DNA-binding XRE family transcriptional regulator